MSIDNKYATTVIDGLEVTIHSLYNLVGGKKDLFTCMLPMEFDCRTAEGKPYAGGSIKTTEITEGMEKYAIQSRVESPYFRRALLMWISGLTPASERKRLMPNIQDMDAIIYQLAHAIRTNDEDDLRHGRLYGQNQHMFAKLELNSAWSLAMYNVRPETSEIPNDFNIREEDGPWGTWTIRTGGLRDNIEGTFQLVHKRVVTTQVASARIPFDYTGRIAYADQIELNRWLRDEFFKRWGRLLSPTVMETLKFKFDENCIDVRKAPVAKAINAPGFINPRTCSVIEELAPLMWMVTDDLICRIDKITDCRGVRPGLYHIDATDEAGKKVHFGVGGPDIVADKDLQRPIYEFSQITIDSHLANVGLEAHTRLDRPVPKHPRAIRHVEELTPGTLIWLDSQSHEVEKYEGVGCPDDNIWRVHARTAKNMARSFYTGNSEKFTAEQAADVYYYGEIVVDGDVAGIFVQDMRDIVAGRELLLDGEWCVVDLVDRENLNEDGPVLRQVFVVRPDGTTRPIVVGDNARVQHGKSNGYDLSSLMYRPAKLAEEVRLVALDNIEQLKIEQKIWIDTVPYKVARWTRTKDNAPGAGDAWAVTLKDVSGDFIDIVVGNGDLSVYKNCKTFTFGQIGVEYTPVKINKEFGEG